jgi:hypothetical protein
VIFFSVNAINFVRFYVLATVSVKKAGFWDVALCSLVETDRRFGGTYCLHHQGDDAAMRRHEATSQKTDMFAVNCLKTMTDFSVLVMKFRAVRREYLDHINILIT